MYSRVIIQFGMKCSDELPTLTGCNDMTIDLGQNFTIRRQYIVDIWCTNEGHGDVVANTLDGGNGVETAQLTTVGVALHIDVHRAQM